MADGAKGALSAGPSPCMPDAEHVAYRGLWGSRIAETNGNDVMKYSVGKGKMIGAIKECQA